MTRTILETEGLTRRFQSLVAVDGMSVSFADDEVCAIIGPNGAGKTTFFNLLSGSLTPTSGRIVFDGEDITGRSATGIARAGLIRSFQVTKVFEQLTVLENVRIATQARRNPYDFWHDVDDITGPREEAERIIDDVGLADRTEHVAANLSHGEQRTLEIAITLGADPVMLLLDEPTSGMSASETQEVIELIDVLAEQFPILIIEHKMGVLRRIADRVVVFHRGSKLADGTPDEIQDNDEVRRVYLKEVEL